MSNLTPIFLQAGQPVPILSEMFAQRQNQDGGLAAAPDHQSSVQDTAHALAALRAGGTPAPDGVARALSFLADNEPHATVLIGA